MIRINDLGNFDNISEVWNQYPEGGKEGDYLTINGVEYGWDKYALLWVNGILLNESAARYNTVFDGNVIVQNNLTVAGTLRAKRLKQPNMGLFATEDALRAAIPTPEVGMWATVGDTVPGAIYRCDTAGEWTATGETGGVDNPEYDSVVERLEQLLLRMQGRGSEHDNVFDPFYYKEFSNGDQAYADVRTWLDGLHSTVGGANPLSFLRLFVNGAWVYVLQNGLSYAQDVHSQTILNGTLMPDGGIRPGKDIYVRISKPLADRTSETDIWEPWRKLYDQSDINYFYDNVIVGNYAPLADGKVPTTYLPAYVDEILEYPTESDFPRPGGDAKIYIALNTNRQYRWSGTQYSEVSPTLALGETWSTAFPGNRGKALETAQATLTASVASAVQSVETLSGAVNGKAAQADVTALANRMTSAEGDIDNLKTAVSDMATKSGDNTFTGDNYFAAAEIAAIGAGNINVSATIDEESHSSFIGPLYIQSESFRKKVGSTYKELATVEEMNTALAGKASTEALQAEALRAQTAEQALANSKADIVYINEYMPGGEHEGELLPTGVYRIGDGFNYYIPNQFAVQDKNGRGHLVFSIMQEDIEVSGLGILNGFIVFWCGGNILEELEYEATYTRNNAPDWLLRAIGQFEATTETAGLMSAEDKSHLDTLWDERGGGGGSDTFATLFAALTAEGGVIRMGNNYMDFNSNNGVSWGVLKPLLLNTSTEGSVHQIENNHYTNRDTNYLDNEVYSDDANFSLAEISIGQDEYAFECQGSNVIVKSGHDLYAVVLNIQPSSTVTLNIADEDNTQSTTVTLTNTATFTEVVLDYGNTPLASGKKIYITDASGNDLNIMLQPTLKFLPI